MPPKNKGKKKKAGALEPKNEDDFLEAADDFEQQGGKHRAGDPAKSARAFQRAFEVYDAGITKFPRSFDLVYNKAVLQFQLAEDPRIYPHFGTQKELLQEALTSHQQALRLNEEDANAVFNTAQVLTSLAEMLVDSNDTKDRENTIPLFQQAIELFSSCLTRQEAEYSDMKAALAELEEGGGVPLTSGGQFDNPSTPSLSETSEKYATVMDTITPETILETIFAQVGALTSLISAYSLFKYARNPLDAVDSIASPLFGQKIPYYISLLPMVAEENQKPTSAPSMILSLSGKMEKPPEEPTGATQASATAVATLLRGNFRAAMADAECRFGLIDPATYSVRLVDAFPHFPQYYQERFNIAGAKESLDAASAYVEALVAFASTVGDVSPCSSDFSSERMRIDALTQASRQLEWINSNDTALESKRKAELYLLEGDVLLQLRYIIRQPHLPSDQVSALSTPEETNFNSRGNNMLNKTYAAYAEANRHIQHPKTGEEVELQAVARTKMSIICWMGGFQLPTVTMAPKALDGVPGTTVRDVMKEMVEEEMMTMEESRNLMAYAGLT